MSGFNRFFPSGGGSGGGGGIVATNGFIDYNDTSTTTTPLVLNADTWTTIPNDGQGAFTNKAYAPPNVTELMDANGAIECSELSLGDVIVIRNDYTITPQTNNGSLQFRYGLGGGGNEYFLGSRLGRMDSGSGIEYRYSLSTDLIYMGDLNTLNNPIILQINSTAEATLVNAGSVIFVARYNV